MEQINKTIENGLCRTKFAKTFRMSTYLAAWAVLPDTYGKITSKSNEHKVYISKLEDVSILKQFLFIFSIVQIIVWARREPTMKGHTALALEIALNCMSFFMEYFNTSEPLPPKSGMNIFFSVSSTSNS